MENTIEETIAAIKNGCLNAPGRFVTVQADDVVAIIEHLENGKPAAKKQKPEIKS